MFILHSYLTALFSQVAPLALNASIVFKQEYRGVEGHSASCAELYALLSSLSGLPDRRPGQPQGVLIPASNQRHLMLDRSVQDAVERGLFHVYTKGHVSEGIALLTGEALGMSRAELVQAQADELAGGAATVEDTAMQRAQVTLRAYRRACQVAGGARGDAGYGGDDCS